MNLEYFIATRVAQSGKQSFSRLIIRIAIVAIALSVAVMVVATALIRGFKSEISNKIFGFWGHVHITDTSTANLTNDEFPVDVNQDFYPSLDTITKVKYLDFLELFGRVYEDQTIEKVTKGGVRHIQVFATRPGVIKTKNEIEGIVVKGIGKDFDWQYLKKFLVAGEPLTVTDSMVSRQIILSEITAERLDLKVGDTFTIYFVKKESQAPRKFKLAGIYRTGLAEYDKVIALVDIRQIQKLRGWTEEQVGGFEVFLDDIDDLKPMAEHIYLDILPANLYAQSIKDKNRSIFDWLELTNTNEQVLIALMLLVAIINMMTALLILILERTNMIGILKALGHSNWNIRKIFLYYAAYIIVIGLAWGNGIGLFLCWLQDTFRFVKLSEEDYYLAYAPIEINWWIVIALNIGTLLITLIFLIIPSYMVTRISPVKAIRFK
ncbi:MAG: FtsX-like permease family protein [Bacteroidota bacterium]